jgi:predicted Zn-dependent protease with MMP-like domain
MNDRLRDYFDEHLEAVLAELPPQVQGLLDEVPMIVEDHPSRELMRKMGAGRSELCGLHTGVALTDRSVEQSGIPSNAIFVFREGVLSLATGRGGRIDENELRRQIRITILHELGHYHGLDEDELESLGYG